MESEITYSLQALIILCPQLTESAPMVADHVVRNSLQALIPSQMCLIR